MPAVHQRLLHSRKLRAQRPLRDVLQPSGHPLPAVQRPHQTPLDGRKVPEGQAHPLLPAAGVQGRQDPVRKKMLPRHHPAKKWR